MRSVPAGGRRLPADSLTWQTHLDDRDRRDLVRDIVWDLAQGPGAAPAIPGMILGWLAEHRAPRTVRAEDLATLAEVASMLGYTTSTLKTMRSRGADLPPALDLGLRDPVWCVGTVRAWAAAHRR